MAFVHLAHRLRRGAGAARLLAPLLALWKLLWHCATPWRARLVAGAALLYWLSPIDLIPDAVPVFGWLDDLAVLTLGIGLASRLVPRALWQARLHEAQLSMQHTLPRVLWGALAVGLLWLLLLAAAAWWLLRQAAAG
jgi:uncharacterized membrane protein YkvA (DUF1232 family)